MSSLVISRGWTQRALWRIGAALLLALLATVYSTRTTHAAPPVPIDPCIDPGTATIIDPAGGAVQVRMYAGALPINVANYPTSIERIELDDGTIVYGFCINSTQARLTGVIVCLLSEISNVRLNYLIAKYPPDTQNRINQAARQAAVWHYSNGINLDMADPTTEGPEVDAQVAALYTALLQEVDAIDPANPTGVLAPGPLAMAIDPVAAINQLPENPDHPFTVRITKGGSPIAGVLVQVASNFGSFDNITATTNAVGEAEFAISSSQVGTAAITATAVVTIPKSLEYAVRDDPTGVQPFGIPGFITETVTALASKEWREAPPPPPGRITLTKLVAGTEEPWSFVFALDGVEKTATKSAPVVAWDNLLPGRTYTLREIVPGSDWRAGPFACFRQGGVAVGAAGPNGFEIPVVAGDDITCSITNTKIPPGEITLTKRVSGTTDPWQFTFRLAGAPLPDERTAFNSAPEVSWTGLTPGETYRLTEVDTGLEWQQGTFACTLDGAPIGTPVTGGIDITVGEGTRILCEITNTRIPPPPDTGAITVTKTVAGTTADWQFEFTLNGGEGRFATKASPTVVWSNLPAGNYTLLEVMPATGWQQGTLTCAVNGQPVADANPAAPGFEIVLQPGASVTCAVENTKLPETGAITVTKTVTGTTDNWFFVFTLNGGRPVTVTNTAPTATWSGLQPGAIYTLAEVNPGSDWAPGEFTCAVNGVPVGDADPITGGFQVLVEPGKTVACAMTNTKLPPPAPGRITLTKVVTQTSDDNWAFAFELANLDGSNPRLRTVTKANPTTVWNDLTPGVTYVLSEKTPGPGFVEGNFVCTLNGAPAGSVEPNGPITLPVNPGDNIVCIKYNEDMTGTDLPLGSEPSVLGKTLYLPLVNR